MTHLKQFFHDRFVLFLLTINSFLTLVSLAAILLRLGGGQSTYVVAYRFNLGLSAATPGGVGEMISFVLFAVILFVLHIFLAIKFYAIKRVSAWVVLIMTTLLLVLNLIVASSLLNLR